MDVLSLSLCHIVVVVIIFTCIHVSHRRGRESNPDLSDESTECHPLHCACISGVDANIKISEWREVVENAFLDICMADFPLTTLCFCQIW